MLLPFCPFLVANDVDVDVESSEFNTAARGYTWSCLVYGSYFTKFIQSSSEGL